MPNGFRIRPAQAADLPTILSLLETADLPLDGVSDHLADFFVAGSETSAEATGPVPIVACGGLENYGANALLRSVAIAPGVRGTGLGSRLVQALIDSAQRKEIRSLILLTTTAAGFFPRFGFREIGRGDVPEAVRGSKEFQGACPSTATVMRLELERSLSP